MKWHRGRRRAKGSTPSAESTTWAMRAQHTRTLASVLGACLRGQSAGRGHSEAASVLVLPAAQLVTHQSVKANHMKDSRDGLGAAQAVLPS
eukprot:2550603-Pleurochrysis_carterae.AAC.5